MCQVEQLCKELPGHRVSVHRVCTKAQGQEGFTAFSEDLKRGHVAKGCALV